MDNQPKEKYDWFTRKVIDTERLENPSLPRQPIQYPKWIKIFGWILFFVVTHLWWVWLFIEASYCEGGMGSGHRCTNAAIQNYAGTAEVTLLLFLFTPPFLPLLFYSKLYRKVRGNAK